MTMMESISFLANSHYLRLLSILVISYGLSINFTEIIWKSLVKKQYPNPLLYQRYMGQFSSIVGICTCIVIFFGVHIIRLLGWKIGSMLTPILMSIVSIPFFVCIIFPGSTDGTMDPLRLATAVLFGTITSLVSKTSKYALFDPTTQMAYIPLDDESKSKGKAAIDVLGSRIGKSGGSFIQQGLVVLFHGSILNASPVVCLLYYMVLFVWIYSANQLSILFTNAQQQQQQEQQNNNNDDETSDLLLKEEIVLSPSTDLLVETKKTQ